ncbi:MAG: winged helix-turn-helix domain-containing protein [Nitrospinota bacterium]
MVDFKEHVIARLEDLQAEAHRVKQEMFPFQERLERINSQIDGLRLYLRASDPSRGDALSRSEGERLSALDHIERILRRAGKPLHYLEILDRLKTEENFDIGGKDPKSNMTAKLSTRDRFVRMGRAVYGLRGWRTTETEDILEDSSAPTNAP